MPNPFAPEAVAVPVQRPSGRPPTLRQQREATAKRVLDEVQRSGTVPATLRQHMIDNEYRFRWLDGKPMNRDDVARYVDQWAADLLSKHDKERGA